MVLDYRFGGTGSIVLERTGKGTGKAGGVRSWSFLQHTRRQLRDTHSRMGVCSSTVGPELTPAEFQARRKETVKFREKYAERAKKITPPPNCLLCVEVEPWIAAPEGVRGVDDALATFQRGSHTSTKEINMALSGMVSVDNKYDYKKSVVLR